MILAGHSEGKMNGKSSNGSKNKANDGWQIGKPNKDVQRTGTC